MNKKIFATSLTAVAAVTPRSSTTLFTRDTSRREQPTLSTISL